MNNQLAYDLPTRIFHWCFGILFVFSFFVAKVIDDDSALYAYHMLSGLMMSFLIVLRIFWGVFGTKYARFSSFMLRPSDLLEYLRTTITGKTKRTMGHNPASSYATIIMFILSFVMLITGALMSKHVFKDFFEEIHELAANGFVVIVLLHIAGVVFHQLRHGDNIGFSMITGNKQGIDGAEGIKSSKYGVAIIFVALINLSASYLLSSYNTETQSLSLPGIKLQLGETENHDEDGKYREDDD